MKPSSINNLRIPLCSERAFLLFFRPTFSTAPSLPPLSYLIAFTGAPVPGCYLLIFFFYEHASIFTGLPARVPLLPSDSDLVPSTFWSRIVCSNFPASSVGPYVFFYLISRAFSWNWALFSFLLFSLFFLFLPAPKPGSSHRLQSL